MLSLRYIILSILLLLSSAASTQRVTVSDLFDIRQNDNFKILGKVGNHILNFIDRGKKQSIHLYDDDLSYLFEKELRLANQRYKIQNINALDSTVNIYYTTKDEGGSYLHVTRLDQDARLIESLTLIDSSRVHNYTKVGSVLSKDKSKILFFAKAKKSQMHFILVDNKSAKVLWETIEYFPEIKIRQDFRSVFVTNEGQANILFEKNNNKRNRDTHHFQLYGVHGRDDIYMSSFDLNGVLTVNLDCQYDEINKNVMITGLYAERDPKNPNGYFIFIKELSKINDQENIPLHPFDNQFLSELYGRALVKNRNLNDFTLRQVRLREDGGVLIFAERHKEFYRRSQYGNQSRISSYGVDASGWLDTYDEDVVVIALNPDGKVHWKSIIYKKQFSQDEDFIYSSFFLFTTPSRIRVIYNDEIKRNNTVSEYVLDPLGNHKRNSLLSTDYQDLKLVFEDAIQISSQSFIVPSESGTKVNLVKIDYN